MTTSHPIYFHNPGEIDIRGATIAGLSAKETESPIGMFGTGLKYAIASILRWGGTIRIYSGLTEYIFFTRDLDFRDQQFKQIIMDSRGVETPLGFTTEYGRKWEPWQVLRELLANCRDEAGDSQLAPLDPTPNHTLIIVNCHELSAIYHERNEIILPTSTRWAHESSELLIADRPNKFAYYRGVRVQEEPALLTYNVLGKVDLTEDRTLKYAFQYAARVGSAIGKLTDETLLRKILSAPKGTFEANLDYSPYREYSPECLDTMAELYRQGAPFRDRFRAALHENRPDTIAPTALTPTRRQQQMIDRAIRFCALLDMPLTNQKLVIADLGRDRLGTYTAATNTIHLDPKLFEQGTKQVLSTLYEELWHASTGHADLTYEMQTALFNKIISLAEEHIFGEPV